MMNIIIEPSISLESKLLLTKFICLALLIPFCGVVQCCDVWIHYVIRCFEQPLPRKNNSKIKNKIQNNNYCWMSCGQVDNGLKSIKWSFNKATNIHRVSQTHSAQRSVEDELTMVQDLRKLHPVTGRCHAHFPDICNLHYSQPWYVERAVHLAGKAQEPN